MRIHSVIALLFVSAAVTLPPAVSADSCAISELPVPQSFFAKLAFKKAKTSGELLDEIVQHLKPGITLLMEYKSQVYYDARQGVAELAGKYQMVIKGAEEVLDVLGKAVVKDTNASRKKYMEKLVRKLSTLAKDAHTELNNAARYEKGTEERKRYGLTFKQAVGEFESVFKKYRPSIANKCDPCAKTGNKVCRVAAITATPAVPPASCPINSWPIPEDVINETIGDIFSDFPDDMLADPKSFTTIKTSGDLLNMVVKNCDDMLKYATKNADKIRKAAGTGDKQHSKAFYAKYMPLLYMGNVFQEMAAVKDTSDPRKTFLSRFYRIHEYPAKLLYEFIDRSSKQGSFKDPNELELLIGGLKTACDGYKPDIAKNCDPCAKTGDKQCAAPFYIAESPVTAKCAIRDVAVPEFIAKRNHLPNNVKTTGDVLDIIVKGYDGMIKYLTSNKDKIRDMADGDTTHGKAFDALYWPVDKASHALNDLAYWADIDPRKKYWVLLTERYMHEAKHMLEHMELLALPGSKGHRGMIDEKTRMLEHIQDEFKPDVAINCDACSKKRGKGCTAA